MSGLPATMVGSWWSSPRADAEMLEEIPAGCSPAGGNWGGRRSGSPLLPVSLSGSLEAGAAAAETLTNLSWGSPTVLSSATFSAGPSRATGAFTSAAFDSDAFARVGFASAPAVPTAAAARKSTSQTGEPDALSAAGSTSTREVPRRCFSGSSGRFPSRAAVQSRPGTRAGQASAFCYRLFLGFSSTGWVRSRVKDSANHGAGSLCSAAKLLAGASSASSFF